MSRKDTIIIAVLINAGLLIVLFASALKSNFSPQEVAASPKPKTAELIVKKEYPIHAGDEVDQALHQLAAAPTAAGQQPPAFPSATQVTAPSVVSFADDIKTFAAPESMSTAIFSQPAISTAAEEKKSSEYTEIKVKKGDVLEKIARNHHTSVDTIIAFNQLSSTNLRIGQTLKIPNKKVPSSSSPSVVTTSTNTSDGHKYYTVKNGDNPWTIAVKNHMKVEDLLKINNLDQEKARKLKPGDKLLIQ
jgi:LysM repeat protein